MGDHDKTKIYLLRQQLYFLRELNTTHTRTWGIVANQLRVGIEDRKDPTQNLVCRHLGCRETSIPIPSKGEEESR